MEEGKIAFIIWAILGVFFVVMGIYDMTSKKEKPFGFWANAGLLIMTMLGTMFLSIGAMVTYVVGIEPKYRKKK